MLVMGESISVNQLTMSHFQRLERALGPPQKRSWANFAFAMFEVPADSISLSEEKKSTFESRHHLQVESCFSDPIASVSSPTDKS